MLSGKRVVVAGAAGLLGGKVVSACLEADADVIALDLDPGKTRARLQQLGLGDDNSSLTIDTLNLSDETAVNAWFNSTSQIDGAVNCSYPRNARYGAHFFDVGLDDFNDNVSLHLGSSFLFMQACARYYKNHSLPFALVNIASIYGVVAPSFDVYKDTAMTMPVEYAAVKSAIIHLTKYVTAYMGESQFRANCVSPGGIYDGQPPEFCEAYRRKTLGKGMLDLADVVGTITFLLADASGSINGQNLVVDDGFTL